MEFTVVIHVRPGHDNQATLFDKLTAVLDSHGFYEQYAITTLPGSPADNLIDGDEYTIDQVNEDVARDGE